MPEKKGKNYSKWFLTRVVHAIQDFEMIRSGDRIAVGISGGKDSLALLFIMNLLRKSSHLDFEIVPITIDLGLGADYTPIGEYCDKEALPFIWEKTDIAEIVFGVRKEENPCALCANLRRGALNDTAKRNSCSRVALGHHLDDAIETLFLNLCFTGRLSTFKPVTYLDRIGLWQIRPLVYLPEETLEAISEWEGLPRLQNPCPASGKTKRQEMKEIIALLEKRFPKIKDRFLTAFLKGNRELFWKMDS